MNQQLRDALIKHKQGQQGSQLPHLRQAYQHSPCRKSVLMILKHLETDASLFRIQEINDAIHKTSSFKIKTFAAVCFGGKIN